MSKKMLPLIKEVQLQLKDLELDLNQTQTEGVIDAVWDSIVNVVIAQGELKVGGYGKFSISEVAARKIKHPETKEEVIAPAYKKLWFKPLKLIKDKLK